MVSTSRLRFVGDRTKDAGAARGDSRRGEDSAGGGGGLEGGADCGRRAEGGAVGGEAALAEFPGTRKFGSLAEAGPPTRASARGGGEREVGASRALRGGVGVGAGLLRRGGVVVLVGGRDARLIKVFATSRRTLREVVFFEGEVEDICDFMLSNVAIAASRSTSADIWRCNVDI